MKKLIALILTLTLTFTLALSALAEAGPAGPLNIGVLTMLNLTEEEYLSLISSREMIIRQMGPDGIREDAPAANKIVFYDTLNALLMGFEAGDIQSIEIYESVARYLCAANSNLQIGPTFDSEKTSEGFALVIRNGIFCNDFAFLMMENNAPLRDEFSAAIIAMKADGTLDRLVTEQIDNLVDGGEIKPIEMPHFDGAETVKVAVTGALPPMDYVAEDGTPAGFNTAVLAEISSRIGKNIELQVVDSLGRAAALASGAVDAVFWTRTNSTIKRDTDATEAEQQEWAKATATITEEEQAVLIEVLKHMDGMVYVTADMPDGTIVTEPYFSDVLVPVMPAGK